MTQPRILVAEGEHVLASDLCETVKEVGYCVEGPHSDMSSAMLAFQKEKPDLAILDVRLDDGVVYPLAEKLAQENVPIIFHLGRNSRADVRKRFPKAKTMAKPCPPNAMIDAVSKVLAAH